MSTASWSKKLTLALVASIAFSGAPIAAWRVNLNITWRKVALVAAALAAIRMLTKEHSKNPVSCENLSDRIQSALDELKAATTKEERSAARKKLFALIAQAFDDMLIGFPGKKKGLLAEGKVVLEGEEHRSMYRNDGGQVVEVIKYADVEPYGLLGSAWSMFAPVGKAAGTLVAAAVALDKVHSWTVRHTIPLDDRINDLNEQLEQLRARRADERARERVEEGRGERV